MFIYCTAFHSLQFIVVMDLDTSLSGLSNVLKTSFDIMDPVVGEMGHDSPSPHSTDEEVGPGFGDRGLGSPSSLMCDEELLDVGDVDCGGSSTPSPETPKVWPCPDCAAACDSRALLGAHLKELHIDPVRVTVQSVSVFPTDTRIFTGHSLRNTESPGSASQASPVLTAPLPDTSF